MATSFTNAVAANIGATEQVVYTTPVATKAILIGCNIANKTNSELPVSLILRKLSGDVYLVKNQRVGPGEKDEIMRGNKLVMAAGDSILGITAIANGFDVIVSVLEGV
jgi:hypothetical protein